MHVGALIFPTDLSIHPARLARELEDRGYESLWVTEHTHIPTSRKTEWPGGADLPDEYRRTLDPFVALSLAAGVTERLKLATGICLVNQHHPITLAKTVASLDHASAGRVALGIGVGWNVDEMEHHGVDPARRRAHGRETVLAMRALWTQEAAEFHGEIVDFSSSWSWPKPAQAGGPPVLMGGAGGPVTFRHVAEYCDGWMPIHGRRGVFEKLPELRAAWESAGRDWATCDLGVFGCPARLDIIESYRDAGFSRVVLGLPPAPEDTVLGVLDGYADVLAQAAKL